MLQMKMERYRTKKITLSDVLEIGSDSVKTFEPHTLEDLPWHFLRKVMALNVTARSMRIVQHTSNDQTSMTGTNKPKVDDPQCTADDEQSFYFDFMNANDTALSMNPLDVLCALLHCSDNFLQQEIMLKMSMCQFSLPLLLPPCEKAKCTFMLWAMRDIVRKWRPHSLRDSKGFREESLVLIPMPTISFVRLGSFSLSKSRILNEILSPPQQHHDFFIHQDMKSGNVPRKISDGLVETSCYFPGGRDSSDIFTEPCRVANLRGDIQSHWLQFSFLTEVSSALFIFTDGINEREYALLSSLGKSKTKVYFILNPQTSIPVNDTMGFIMKLAPLLQLNKSNVLLKEKTMNEAEFVSKLHFIVKDVIMNPTNTKTLEDMAVIARELGVHVDEDLKECQTASWFAKEVTNEIKNVVEYKKRTIKLQGDLWKRLARVEKELCRMKRQGDTPPEDYVSQLKKQLVELRRQQNECDLTTGMMNFITGIQQLDNIEKHFFLKWMKFHLDCIARNSISKLKSEYKESCKTPSTDPKGLAELDRRISESSLGVEHFMRELGQFYEAECSMVREGKLEQGRRQFINLPGMAADLLLEGFPLELIDGDTSNIPMQWVTDVLNQLNTKLGGQCRMVVITVLGVQSTGKSTLLNTMFGLQFAVSSGRCTRGAFMLLIKVKENQKEELGCDFFLIIDTEGLKAPELSTLEDSYEHDNELATLVIGLSDITIVNMAMENATEMKDILQIAIHAFLRMEQTGKKTNCQFVHQNVCDVSAHELNMRDRKHLLEQLNEMTKTAAKMEKQRREMIFSDIMDYDPEKHNWYIPGLWHGVPPMASVNTGYSEHIQELKQYLLTFIKSRARSQPAQDIPSFIEWVRSLWKAIKHENFIFSFRNSLVADAYNQLSVKYSEWEWNFRKEMQLWVSDAETKIQNQLSDTLCSSSFDNLRHEAYQILEKGEKKMLHCLETYFDSGVENVHLIERYREDFCRSVTCLKNELHSYSVGKCEEALRIQKGKYKMQNIQTQCLKTIEREVVTLLEQCRERRCKLNQRQLLEEFETMWRTTVSELNPMPLQKHQIDREMFHLLRKDLHNRGSMINQMLHEASSLQNYGLHIFKMEKKYIDIAFFSKQYVKELFKRECWPKAGDLAESIMDTCQSYVDKKIISRTDYDETYCRELLHMINEVLQQDHVQKLHTTSHFEVALKLHILGKAARAFQVMHEVFIRKNDPQLKLERFKPQYFSTFNNLYLEKDESQKKAKDFCDQCLKPALNDHVCRRLGIEIVDDILHSGESLEYSSRTFFQFAVLKKLLEDNKCGNYVLYITKYEKYVKGWILGHIEEHYRKTNGFAEIETNIISTITTKVRKVIQESKGGPEKSVSSFLGKFCKKLESDLVISKDSLEVVLFQNSANVDQFSNDIQVLLYDLQQDLLSQYTKMSFDTKLSNLPFLPQDELFRKVFGCGKQCPFCKVPCEAGGIEHKEHFASVHRPQGIGRYRSHSTKKLVYSLCSTDVLSNLSFRNSDTNGKFHPYKDYQDYYPDWRIQPDSSIAASDYWKFVFNEFNEEFAKQYKALPATLPEDWGKITKEAALASMQEVFLVKYK